MNVIFDMSIHLVYKVQECSCSYVGIRIDKLGYFGKKILGETITSSEKNGKTLSYSFVLPLDAPQLKSSLRVRPLFVCSVSLAYLQTSPER